MSDQSEGSFVCRCHTCGESSEGIDHQTAQAFFEEHLDRGHKPELYRTDEPEIDGPEEADGPDGDEPVGTD